MAQFWRQGDVGRADFRTRRRDSPEKDAQTAIKRLLRLKGIPFWDTSQPRAAMITPGLPDLIIFVQGFLMFVEVKSPRGRLTPEQAEFERCCERAGIPYYVIRSAAELEDVL